MAAKIDYIILPKHSESVIYNFLIGYIQVILCRVNPSNIPTWNKVGGEYFFIQLNDIPFPIPVIILSQQPIIFPKTIPSKIKNLFVVTKQKRTNVVIHIDGSVNPSKQEKRII
ncbi:MAG: hypothetical protein EBW14_10855 [Oxalobacteraceae bacterium]|nr:hypothetical protein [Oxalobacteraceae bacterium]